MSHRGTRVRIEELRKVFTTGAEPINAVDGVSAEIEPGSTVALVGASGSGKSTLLHVVGAIETATSGTVTVDDVEVTKLRPRALPGYRRGVGFVFQRYHLLPALSALDNVLAPLLPYKVAFDRVARGRELLAEVGLAGREDALPAQLSGGQQQRVAVARALIGGPGLLLADEPTGNLDSANGSQILNLLLRLRDERAMTILLATHDREIAARCDSVIRLADGKVAA
jgi:putative ABC transport system ATP-binding protein